MRIIIAGAGEVGSHLAKMLSIDSNDITIIDSDEERLDILKSNTDVITFHGNPSSIEVLKAAGVENADLFIAVNPSSSQDVNIVSALLAKKLGSRKVTARINSEQYLSYENKYLFTEMGIDLLFYPEKIAANEIIDMLKRTSSSDSMDFARGKLQLSVFKLDDGSPIIDKKIKDFVHLGDNNDLKFRVVAISRKNKTIIPGVDTKFKYHDLVLIVTKRDGVETLMDLLGKKDIEVKKLMILGGGPIGEMVAKHFGKILDQVKIIEINKEKCIALSGKLDNKITVVNGDGRNSDMLIEEDIKEFDAFVAVTSSSETNILACAAAKRMGIGRTIAEVENIEYINLAENMGVDAVINKKLITASRVFKFTLSNKVRFIKYMSGTNAEVLEFIVAPDSLITKKKLKDLDFPNDAIIGGIIRGNESIIAVGDSKINAYDRVAVFALPEAVKHVDALFK